MVTVTEGVPHYRVDLTKESLTLAICGTCLALTRQEDYPAHQDWHVQAGERTPGGDAAR